MKKLNNNNSRPTIGFQINNLQGRYAAKLWPGVVDKAHECDLNLIIFPGHTLASPYEYEYQHNAIYSFINTNNLDALIMASGTLCNFIGLNGFQKFYSRFLHLPIVSMAIDIEGIPSVIVDNKSGMMEAVSHLIEVHGHK